MNLNKLYKLKSYVSNTLKKIGNSIKHLHGSAMKGRVLEDIIGSTSQIGNALGEILPNTLVESIKLSGQNRYSDGINTYEIWGNSIAKFSPSANLQGMGPSALYDLQSGEILQDYGR